MLDGKESFREDNESDDGGMISVSREELDTKGESMREGNDKGGANCHSMLWEENEHEHEAVLFTGTGTRLLDPFMEKESPCFRSQTFFYIGCHRSHHLLTGTATQNLEQVGGHPQQYRSRWLSQSILFRFLLIIMEGHGINKSRLPGVSFAPWSLNLTHPLGRFYILA